MLLPWSLPWETDDLEEKPYLRVLSSGRGPPGGGRLCVGRCGRQHQRTQRCIGGGAAGTSYVASWHQSHRVGPLSTEGENFA